MELATCTSDNSFRQSYFIKWTLENCITMVSSLACDLSVSTMVQYATVAPSQCAHFTGYISVKLWFWYLL